MNGGIVRPTKPKQVEGNEDGTYAGHPHACFRHPLTIILSYNTQVVPFLGLIETIGDYGNNRESEELKPLLSRVEVVAFARSRNERQGFVEEMD